MVIDPQKAPPNNTTKASSHQRPRNSKRHTKPKQAVVIIHGMGEQIPMRTLRDFVDAVWVSDTSLFSKFRPDPNTGTRRREYNPVWSKPDRRNRSFELRRMTTERLSGGRRTDFYEFYWAHLMHGTTWEHVKIWFKDLLLRSASRVPDNVYPIWLGLWAITVLLVAIFTLALFPQFTWASTLATAIGTSTVVFGLNVFVLKYFGDVARYVNANPVNVARRQEIRDRGVELLEMLMGLRDHDGEWFAKNGKPPTREYDRIIVVGHSLGAIIAYDILKHSFARVHNQFDDTVLNNPNSKQPERQKMEQMLQKAASGEIPFDLQRFREQQHRCRLELNALGNPWIVSDFISIGAPLTHAEFLLASDEADLWEQQENRILPTCPPVLEWDGRTQNHHFSYRADRDRKRAKTPAEEAARLRYPHHAAHFAFTRWSNIYSPAQKVFWGDIISGPVADHFAMRTPKRSLKGILDVAVLPGLDQTGKPNGSPPFFTHSQYWDLQAGESPKDSKQAPHHIQVLRQVLNLAEPLEKL